MFQALSTGKNELKCPLLKEIQWLFILKADYFELNIHKIKTHKLKACIDFGRTGAMKPNGS